jgi:hypothetical protein
MADNRTRNARLLKLVALLRANARRKTGIKFDYGSWGTIADKENPVSCGTTACAFGLAAVSGEFKRLGLGYKLRGSTEFGPVRFEFLLNGKAIQALNAAQKVFKLSSAEAKYLFVPEVRALTYENWEGAKAELAVARKIQKFVKTGKMDAEPEI